MPERNKRTTSRRLPAPPTEDSFGHLQPQAIDLEQAVLGALMIEQFAFSLVCQILTPESFYDPRHKLIYEAIAQLSQEQKPIDILTVTEQLKRNDTLETAGGPVYISELSMKVSSSAHVEYHARIVAQKALARELISYTSKIQTLAFDATQDVADLLQTAEADLFQISQQQLTKDYTQIDPVVSEAFESIKKAAAQAGGLSGIASGFTKLDSITGGWQNSDLVILAARPAMGKTAFALSMACNMAVDQGIPVAMFSLEMSNVQLVKRLISNVCEIPNEKIRNGQLEPYEWGQLDKNINRLQGAPLYLDDTPSLSVYELRTKARRLVREQGVKLILIDYLQLMNASGMQFSNRQEEVSTVSRNLKGLAKELNIPILALSQLNRSVESRTTSDNGKDSKRPQLSDLRESGAIEQDADMVIFIHRPEYYHIYEDSQGHDLRGMAQIIIAKHRNGRTDDVTLRFRGAVTRFENLDDAQPMSFSEGEEIDSRINSASESTPPPFIDSTGGQDDPLPPTSDGKAPF